MGLMNQREKCILRKPDRVDLCSQFATILAGGLPLANLLVARGGSFFASSRPTLPFTSTLVLRMRCSRVWRFLSEYPAFDFQLSTFNLPARGFPRPDSRSQSIQTFALPTFT